MSSTPPPGWYRDPSYPLTERWWDGTAWTDHRRQPQVPQQPLVQTQSPARGPGRAKAVALAAAGVVLVASIVTGAFVLRGNDGSDQETKAEPTPVTSSETGSDTPSPTKSGPSTDDPTVVVDDLNGITFPLIDGWVSSESLSEEDAVLHTPDTYDCPGDDGLCRHGWVFSRTVTASDETSPEALAKNDIEDAANDTFDRDELDLRPFDGITSHKVVKSGPVAVAGRTGYLVRWRVTTKVGPGGYVQSLAFPSATGSEAPVIVRFAFDAGDEGPPLGDMDEITKGIRPVGDAGTSGGVGSSIGP